MTPLELYRQGVLDCLRRDKGLSLLRRCKAVELTAVRNLLNLCESGLPLQSQTHILNALHTNIMNSEETFQEAFTEPPGTNLAGIPVVGLVLPSPHVSWGRPYYESCAKHVKETFKASKVYIMASASLSKNTDRVEKLKESLESGGAKVIGIGTGIRPHTPWSQILQMAAECRAGGADCIVTLGAGSTTDGAKILVLVCPFSLKYDFAVTSPY